MAPELFLSKPYSTSVDVKPPGLDPGTTSLSKDLCARKEYNLAPELECSHPDIQQIFTIHTEGIL